MKRRSYDKVPPFSDDGDLGIPTTTPVFVCCPDMNDPVHHWVDRLRGRFLVFDGPDGSGKSTQCRRFAQFARSSGLTVCDVREPGGTDIGEQIRRLLLDVANQDMDARCEMLLYMASRAQLVSQKITPALEQGDLVLADRFVSSTLAYQGTAGGLDRHDILDVAKIALRGCWPDLVVLFDVDDHTAAQRITGQTNPKKQGPYLIEPGLFSDRLEIKGQEFHQAVRRGYLQQAKDQPERYLVIDASHNADLVFDQLLKTLENKTNTLENPRKG